MLYLEYVNPLYLVGLFLSLLAYYLMRVLLINGTTCPSKARVDGKTVVITGGNTGIGKETAQELAARGGRVIIGCRDGKKSAEAVAEIRRKAGNEEVFFKKLDLASTDSIRYFAGEILREESRIDILILNAGVMHTPYMRTKDGFEFQFGVNHLGHFLLAHLLLDRLKESAPSRVVVVSSLLAKMGSLDFNDMMWTKRYSSHFSYCRSKLANVMFARELGKRISGSGVTVCSLHPGTIHTDLPRYHLSGWRAVQKPHAYVLMWLFLKTALQGAQTTIYCAVAKEVEGQNGAYFDSCRMKKPPTLALNGEYCRKLWDYSMKTLKLD